VLLGLADNPNPKHFQKVPIALGPASQPDPTNTVALWGALSVLFVSQTCRNRSCVFSQELWLGGRDLLCHKPLGLALGARPRVVGSG